MYGININVVRGLSVALLSASLAFAQPVTTYSNVRIDSSLNTTYRVLDGGRSVSGVNFGSPNNNTGLSVRTGSGSVSTTFINPNMTINASVEKNPVTAKGNINYNPKQLANAFMTKAPNGFPANAKGGWIQALETTLQAHKALCKSGAIELYCLGSLKKEPDPSFDPNIDVALCEDKTGHSCFYRDGDIFSLSIEESLDQEAMIKQKTPTRDLDNWLRECPSSQYCNLDGSGVSVVRDGFWTWNIAVFRRVLGEWQVQTQWIEQISKYEPIYTYVEKENLYCSVINDSCSISGYIETFVPFTFQDLEGVLLEPDTMSDWDFAFVQDDVLPESIFLEDLPPLTYSNVVTSWDSEGNKIDVETITTDISTIVGNNTSSPSVDVSQSTTENTYTNGKLTGSKDNTVVIKPSPSPMGDFLTQPQLESTWERFWKRGEEKQAEMMSTTGITLANEGVYWSNEADKNFDQITNPEIIDVSTVKEEYVFNINADRVCPAPYPVEWQFMGYDLSFTFSFDLICEFMDLISYLVLASAYMSVAWMYIGRLR